MTPQCLMPAPAEATATALRHGRFGVPSATYTYRNGQGAILGYICRFDTASGKQILPCSYWRDESGLESWQWKGFADPRPLYGLNRLTEKPKATVLICEGEKAADAAALLLPEYACITSPGGSNAAHKADWSALAGREVLIWPDADAPGQKYADTVAQLLMPIATSVRVITPPEGVSSGWDAADALAESLASETIRELIATAHTATAATPDATDSSSCSSGSSSDAWPEPLPLALSHTHPKPYPVDVLPPIIREAVCSYQSYGQQPMALVATSAIANVSLACQGLADVARDAQLVGPISLSFILAAESGERKTSADKVFSQAATLWEREQYLAMQSELEQTRTLIEAFKAKKAGIYGQITKLSKDGLKNSKVEELEAQLLELEAEAPRLPIIPNLFFEDVTQEALIEHLSTGWPTAALYSDEAAIVVGGHSFREERALGYFGYLNRLWDGRSFKRHRVTSQSCYGFGRRLTCSLMMQTSVLRTLLNISDGQSRNTGFLARILLACPESTMGTRHYKPSPEANPSVDAFHQRIMQLLSLPLPAGGVDMALLPPVLTLTADAHAAWVAYYNHTEQALGSLGEYEIIKDFAAKSAENAVRLAANFHVFEHGAQGEIDAATIQAGIALASWHLEETKRIFLTIDEPQDLADARLLLAWWLKRGTAETTNREIAQFGPYALRKDVMRRAHALDRLRNHHLLRDTQRGSRAVYQLNPAAREEDA